MNIAILFIITLSVNIIFLLFFENISKSLSIIDKPDGKLKKHTKPVSLLGGL